MGKNVYIFFPALGNNYGIYKYIKIGSVIGKAVYVGKLIALHLPVRKAVAAVIVGEHVIARVDKIPRKFHVFFTIFGKPVDYYDTSYSILYEIVPVENTDTVKGRHIAGIYVFCKDFFDFGYAGRKFIFSDNGGFYGGIKHFYKLPESILQILCAKAVIIMANDKKRNLKRVLSVTVIIVIAFTVFSFGATKIIYDLSFPRYDGEYTANDEALETLNESRTEKDFLSCGNKLKGYLYPAANGKKDGLIVIAQGMNATAKDYLWQIKCFTESGYGVFIFDPTGCGKSEGKSAVGFPQLLIDLDAALDYIEDNESFDYTDIFLFGHSRGGYAVCCVAEEHNVTAVASVNGINSAMEGVMMPAAAVAGDIVYTNYPFLWLYQVFLFGTDAVNASAADVLESTDTKALIIHAEGDDVVPEDRFSIISHIDEISSESVTAIEGYGNGEENAHVGILFDENGRANGELMKMITDFFDKAATEAVRS